ncbi:hypothetical protein AVEN_213304-1 [Araneus ventricosus]|uniref:Uncharacterized protein n=1 Tax=Araneus ventricosus TaxID=182803 RepID=A0A4Y2KFM9_ARAVE|nr:hypothetical protein AVEN_213304-1 [Araneus ventricosus]
MRKTLSGDSLPTCSIAGGFSTMDLCKLDEKQLVTNGEHVMIETIHVHKQDGDDTSASNLPPMKRAHLRENFRLCTFTNKTRTIPRQARPIQN